MPSPGSDERASSITTRTFAVRRKGVDPDEVRAYLGQLAEMVSRLTSERDDARAAVEELRAAAEARPAVDEDQLTAALGEETARVLSSARHAANEMRQRAEEDVARMVSEATAEAEATRKAAGDEAASRRKAAEDEAERVGEEIRRAQEAAEEARRVALAEATEEADRIRADADAVATRLREEAAGVLELRTREAEVAAGEIRTHAEAEAAERVATAEAQAAEIRAGAESDREAAQAEGREMVAEAQRVRERMLADLARRRKAARIQLEQLQGARDRLLDAYEAVQRTMDEATAGLRTALPAARSAAEAARIRAESEPEATIEQLETQIAAARDAGLPLVAPTGETAEPITDEVPITSVEAVTEPPPASPPVVDAAEAELPGDGGHEPAPPEPPVADVPVSEPDPVPEAGAAPEPPEADGTVPDREGEVDEIFARIKAERDDAEEAAAGEGAIPAEPVPAEPVPDEVVASGDAEPDDDPGDEPASEAGATDASDALLTLLERRDGMIDPIEARVARRLKRVLADEQGQVLDAVRRAKGRADLDDVLSTDDQVTAYALAVADDLRGAAEEGAAFEGASLPSSATAAVDEVARELGRELAGVVRPRVARCLEAGDDAEDTSDRLRAAYREWKTDRLIEVTRHLVLSAFGEGQCAVRPAGAPVRWVPDPDHPACPDCEDDVLAGAVPSGEAFPTGHTHPPAHPGCRCLVVSEQVAAPV